MSNSTPNIQNIAPPLTQAADNGGYAALATIKKPDNAHSARNAYCENSENSANKPNAEAKKTATASQSYSLSVLVTGVHCAGCIRKIESGLLSQDHVTHARLNFSTGRLAIEWSGTASEADGYVALIESFGYHVHPYDPDASYKENEAEEKFLLMCLGVAGFAAGNIMLLSVGLWSTDAATMGGAMRDFLHWISALIAIPALLFSARPFYQSAIGALRKGHANMDVPITLALFLAAAMSLYETIRHGEHIYFDSAIMLMFFLLIGRYLDFRARKNARSTATDLLGKLSGFATVLENGQPRSLPVKQVTEGMVLRVAAGESFPVDGRIESGESEADMALVTGETMPEPLHKGRAVYAGTVNISAPVTMIASAPAEDSLLADIIKLMEQAGQGQAKYVRIADRAAKLYTPLVHTAAALAFLFWWGYMGAAWQDALLIAVTVLIITCPCALGLAVPVVQVLASGRLMKHGILVKAGDALERLAAVDMVLLDKTGTLTHGLMELEPPPNGTPYDPQTLQRAASLAAHSAHPLSKALTASFAGELLPLENVREISGKGVEAHYNGSTIRLGQIAWCAEIGQDSAANIPQNETFGPILALAQRGAPIQIFTFTDHLRSDAAATIKALEQEHLTPILLSGDRPEVVAHIAAQAGITEYHGGQTPPDKYNFLQEKRNQGHTIMMVGDGLNDAPVLAGADISMAPGTAITLAQNAADIVFMGEKLAPVYEAHQTATRAQRLVKQNFMLAICYNIVAVPLALTGAVTPLIAALAMSGSSLLVITNSFRLKLGKAISVETEGPSNTNTNTKAETAA